MFYSHQLLARKAPLGQIWMAATMHAKMNRKNLKKLNLIKICEEILNPSVPMALRLSGILMGGVVIVYERKVNLLYDDVSRLLVELNEAWKVKPAPDRTVLPKGKTQAKKETVTLPENQEMADLGDVEQSRNFSNSNATMGFQRTAYFAMRLDDVEEPMEEDAAQHLHQAAAENIKLDERFDFYEGPLEHNQFERFDIEGDEETHMDIPSTLIPSPPIQEEAPRAEEVQDPPKKQFNQQWDESKEARTTVPLPPEPSSSSPLVGGNYQDPIGYPFEEFYSGVASDSLGISIEKLRKAFGDNKIPMEILGKGASFGLMDNGRKTTTEASMVTPGNSDDDVRSIPSSGSGHGHQPEVHSGRANKKRLRSASRHSGSSLKPVEEENSLHFLGLDFKLSRLSENDPGTDQEILVETGPTQTQHPIIGQHMEKITDTVRMQMKKHFDTPGSPSLESLNKLADRMNRKGAAMLFYQTCVLAAREFLSV